MILYNSIGKDYNATRQSDLRIVQQLVTLLGLPQGSTIVDVGAGTGNYSNAIADLGYQVIAIEPAAVMQSQRQTHPRVSWINAAAENIPLADNSVDGVVAMLSIHHFNDLELGIREMARVSRAGKIVIFAFEQRKIPDFWLTDYFPYFIGDTLATFPSMEVLAKTISQISQKEVEIIPFLLPTNLSDLFAAAGWCQPEIYLDDQVRNGISTFAKMPEKEMKIGLKRLARDIDNGIWAEKYGYLLQQESYDAGYRILVTK